MPSNESPISKVEAAGDILLHEIQSKLQEIAGVEFVHFALVVFIQEPGEVDGHEATQTNITMVSNSHPALVEEVLMNITENFGGGITCCEEQKPSGKMN